MKTALQNSSDKIQGAQPEPPYRAPYPSASTLANWERRHSNLAPQFPLLATETRTHVPTDCAANWLMRQQQTLRGWACREDGPLRPIRVNGRLAWAVVDIRRLLGVA